MLACLATNLRLRGLASQWPILVKAYAKPSLSADPTQRKEIELLSIFLEDALADQCKEFVTGVDNQPMLRFYSSDGAPIRTHKKVERVVKGVRVKSEGK